MNILPPEELEKITKALWEPSFAVVNAGFFFRELPGVGNVILCNELLPFKRAKLEWFNFREDAENNPLKYSVPSTVSLYQVCRKLYKLKEKEETFPCKELLRKAFSEWLHTGTTIHYGEYPKAVISHLLPEGDAVESEVKIPDLYKSENVDIAITLAEMQPSAKLGVSKEIPSSIQLFAKALLGEGYEEAGAVFQYIMQSQNIEKKLNIIRLCIPTKSNRYSKIEYAVVLGGGWFDILTGYSPSIKQSACGIRRGAV